MQNGGNDGYDPRAVDPDPDPDRARARVVLAATWIAIVFLASCVAVVVHTPADGATASSAQPPESTTSSPTTGPTSTSSTTATTDGLVPPIGSESIEDGPRATAGRPGPTSPTTTPAATTTTTPAPVGPTPSAPMTVALGQSHTCAITSESTVSCWGQGEFGQLGNGTRGRSSTPVPVRGLTGVTGVAAGTFFSCAMTGDGTVSCWGANDVGQLGDGTDTDSTTPVRVTGIADAVAITAGLRWGCALHATGAVSCWGDNYSGHLGNGSEELIFLTPTPVVGITDAIEVETGWTHTCAVLAGRDVRCWGENSLGGLGDGRTYEESRTPVTVVGISDAIAVSSDYHYSCALTASSTVKCWGAFNQFHQFGDAVASSSTTAVQAPGITGADGIGAGQAFLCVLRSDGGVHCLGSNDYQQLGDGTHTASTTLVAVVGVGDAVQIAPGNFHTCARMADSSVMCWGQNSSGELGTGSTSSSDTAHTVLGL